MSGLRSKLRNLGVTAAPQKTVRRSALTCTDFDFPLPAGLRDPLGARALRRMGADFDWPDDIERVLFLDTETTGLSRGAGTIAFLIGVGAVCGDRYRVTQCMLGDYPDEPEMLAWLAALSARYDALVTFNGQSFDMPLLEARYTVNRMRSDCPRLGHLDLLKPARKLWRKRLGSVRLSVLEERVLMAGRTDDLPGSEAPKRFFEALRTGDRAPLEAVASHNRLDVLALARLLPRLAIAYEYPEREAEIADLYALGRTLERGGESADALTCYALATKRVAPTSIAALKSARIPDEATMAMGMLYKRMGDLPRAALCWRQVAQAGRAGIKPLIELAMYEEHARRDCACALQWTERALAAAPDDTTRAALLRRKDRLVSKLSKQTEA